MSSPSPTIPQLKHYNISPPRLHNIIKTSQPGDYVVTKFVPRQDMWLQALRLHEGKDDWAASVLSELEKNTVNFQGQLRLDTGNNLDLRKKNRAKVLYKISKLQAPEPNFPCSLKKGRKESAMAQLLAVDQLASDSLTPSTEAARLHERWDSFQTGMLDHGQALAKSFEIYTATILAEAQSFRADVQSHRQALSSAMRWEEEKEVVRALDFSEVVARDEDKDDKENQPVNEDAVDEIPTLKPKRTKKTAMSVPKEPLVLEKTPKKGKKKAESVQDVDQPSETTKANQATRSRRRTSTISASNGEEIPLVGKAKAVPKG